MKKSYLISSKFLKVSIISFLMILFMNVVYGAENGVSNDFNQFRKILPWIFLILAMVITAISIPFSLILDKRRKTKLAETRSYKWGYFTGCFWFLSGIIILISQIVIPIEVNTSINPGEILLAILCCFLSLSVIRRKRWALIGSHVLYFFLVSVSFVVFGNSFPYIRSFVPVIALGSMVAIVIICVIYTKNRWEEFKQEALPLKLGEEANKLFKKASKMEARGNIEQALSFYREIINRYPSSTLVEDAKSCVLVLEKRLASDYKKEA